MHRFATPLRFAVILAVAIAFGMLARLIPSPYQESTPMSASRTEESSAPDATSETMRKVKPKFRGVDVDQNRLTLASTIS